MWRFFPTNKNNSTPETDDMRPTPTNEFVFSSIKLAEKNEHTHTHDDKIHSRMNASTRKTLIRSDIYLFVHIYRHEIKMCQTLIFFLLTSSKIGKNCASSPSFCCCNLLFCLFQGSKLSRYSLRGPGSGNLLTLRAEHLPTAL
jgi:hypothetical protein